MDALQCHGAHQHVLLDLYSKHDVDLWLLALLHKQHSEPSLLCPVQRHLQEHLQTAADMQIQEYSCYQKILRLCGKALCTYKQFHWWYPEAGSLDLFLGLKIPSCWNIYDISAAKLWGRQLKSSCVLFLCSIKIQILVIFIGALPSFLLKHV